MEKKKRKWILPTVLGTVLIITIGLLYLFTRKDPPAVTPVTQEEKPQELEAVVEVVPEEVVEVGVTGKDILTRLKTKEEQFSILVASLNFLKLSRAELSDLEIEAYVKYSVLMNETTLAQEIEVEEQMVPLKFLNFGVPVPDSVLYRIGEEGAFTTGVWLVEGVTEEEQDDKPEYLSYKGSEYIHRNCSYQSYPIYDADGQERGTAYIEMGCGEIEDKDE